MAERGPFAIEFELTPADVRTAVVFMVRKSRFRSRWNWALLIGAPLFFAATSLTEWPPSVGEILFSSATGLVIVLVLLAVLPQLSAFMSARQTVWFGVRRMEISMLGIKFVTPHREGFIRWPGIVDVAITKGAIYVYETPVQVLILPRRAFSDDEGFSACAQAIRGWAQKPPPASAGAPSS